MYVVDMKNYRAQRRLTKGTLGHGTCPLTKKLAATRGEGSASRRRQRRPTGGSGTACHHDPDDVHPWSSTSLPTRSPSSTALSSSPAPGGSSWRSAGAQRFSSRVDPLACRVRHHRPGRGRLRSDSAESVTQPPTAVEPDSSVIGDSRVDGRLLDARRGGLIAYDHRLRPLPHRAGSAVAAPGRCRAAAAGAQFKHTGPQRDRTAMTPVGFRVAARVEPLGPRLPEEGPRAGR